MIRTAGVEDVEDIYNLNCELFETLNMLKENIYNPIGFSKIFITSMINSVNSDYLLIEEDNKTIGYILIEERVSPYKEYDSFVEDHYAFIYEFVIRAQYRSKGYGKKLLSEARNWAKSRKLTSIELNVLNNNYSAKAFYENNGFEEYQVKLRKEI